MTRYEKVQAIYQGSGRKWSVARPRIAKWAGSARNARRRLRRWEAARNFCAKRAQVNHSEGRRVQARLWRRRRRWAGKRVVRLRGVVHRERFDAPSWLPPEHARQWAQPWTVSTDPNKAKRFKKVLWKHARLSPSFTRAEARSKDSTRANTRDKPVPSHLRANAQQHAFALERVRHDCGDQPMRPLSWYRSGTPGVHDGHNYRVGGARWSRHKLADATDWSDAERVRLGSNRFNASMRRHMSGLGFSNGNVRHGDNRPTPATWNY